VSSDNSRKCLPLSGSDCIFSWLMTVPRVASVLFTRGGEVSTVMVVARFPTCISRSNLACWFISSRNCALPGLKLASSQVIS
jgi:hypothetical protein